MAQKGCSLTPLYGVYDTVLSASHEMRVYINSLTAKSGVQEHQLNGVVPGRI